MMLQPKEMTKVNIVSTKNMLRRVIDELYGMKLLHIDEFKKAESFFDIGRPFAETTDYSDQLVKLRAMISYFNLAGEEKDIKNLRTSKSKFMSLQKTFTSLLEKINNLKSEEARLTELANNPILKLNIHKNHRSLKSIIIFTGTVKKNFLEDIREQDYEMLKQDLGNLLAIALFVPKKNSDEIKKLLDKHEFASYLFPEMNYDKVKYNLEKVQKKLSTTTNELGKIKKNKQFLLDYAYSLSQLVEKGEAPLKFASSNRAFVATGWIPADRKADFESTVDRITKGKVALYYSEAGHDAPVALDNPRPAKPFEFFINLFTLPKYGEIDPTIIFLITFPIFFGFILGDVGYGIATLALSFLVARAFPKSTAPLFNIIKMAAALTIVFGFVFGEFFGYEFINHPILNRVYDINTMILLTIVVGVIHINLGFAFGFINELRMHGVWRAIFAKGGWYAIEGGGALLALGLTMFNNLMLQIIGIVAFVAGVIMLYKGEGIKGIIELPMLFSNTLSYVRLFAVGLASVALALVINNNALPIIYAGGFMAVAAIAILVMGHFINLVLGIVGAFLHSLRLHYVEFFTKFFEGGGNRYTPFGSKNGGRY